MSKIILGVTGSIAAYKSADIVSGLSKLGHDITVVMTNGGTKFITPLTLQTLSKNAVYTDVFVEDEPSEVKHIALSKDSDLVLIAPATANIISKIACGIADDMLTSLMLAVKNKPILIAPAMNTNMYENIAIRENIEKLKSRGMEIIEPKEALLACGDIGKGALADVDKIIEAVQNKL